MTRTIHRFDIVVHTIDVHGRIHALPVEFQMPADLQQIGPVKMRGIDNFITSFPVFLPPEIFDNLADQTPVRMPVDQARPRHFMGAEKIQSLSQDPMISVLGLLQPLEICVQVFLRIKRRAVNALELFVPLIPSPVCP